jgi:hypothetical protein
LTKPDDDSSATNTRLSSLKRPIDHRWSVNLKEPLPTNDLNGNLSNNYTPINIILEPKDSENPINDPFTNRLDFKVNHSKKANIRFFFKIAF